MRKTISKELRKLANKMLKHYGQHYELRKKIDAIHNGAEIVHDAIEEQQRENGFLIPQPIRFPENIEMGKNYKSYKNDLVKTDHYKKLKSFFNKYGDSLVIARGAKIPKFIVEYEKHLAINQRLIKIKYPELFKK